MAVTNKRCFSLVTVTERAAIKLMGAIAIYTMLCFDTIMFVILTCLPFDVKFEPFVISTCILAS